MATYCLYINKAVQWLQEVPTQMLHLHGYYRLLQLNGFCKFLPKHSSKMSTAGFFWLVGCFGFNGPLRQYSSLYQAVSQREGDRGEIGYMREKLSKQPPPAPTTSAVGPCPTIIQIIRTPRHWNFTQHHRTTRPPLAGFYINILANG